MEMNTRIQVEHPVTEAITGVDLVQWQLRVAAGEVLSFEQKDLSIRGWAFEARINAEDPFNGFRPSAGEVQALELPAGPGVRVDTQLYNGYRIPTHYDSMIAKIIVHGQNRTDALAKLYRALGETVIQGVETTIPYHQALIKCPAFQQGEYTTRFVEENEALLKEFESKQTPLTAESALAAGLRIHLARNLGAAVVADNSNNIMKSGETSAQDAKSFSPWRQAHLLEATRQ
jgi:acetyl-CoA carboxylase biotin carboxylase subunit